MSAHDRRSDNGSSAPSHSPTGVSRSRREFVALGVGALVVASMPWSRRRVLAQRTVPMMGTLADLAVVHSDERYAQAAIGAAVARLDQIERLMTRYRPSSDVGRANAHAAVEGVIVSRETATVLTAALAWADRTDGAFDPTLGRLIELWDVGHRSIPPAAAEIRPFAGRGFHDRLDVGALRGRPAVRFGDQAMALDLGGIAKGYGVDEAVRVLREWGIEHALVNLGGDLYAMGRAADGDAWRVGIRAPDHPGRLVTTFALEDAAVATSGDYLQYFEHGGRRYHHLLDPATAEPRVSAMRSVTVRTDDCLTADAAATAAYGTDRATASGWLARAGARVIHSV